jgi:3-oxoacyl-[acyl-carrier protein] reductase
MDLKLRGKRVAVVGASRSLGRAIAESFVEEGAAVALCARNAEQLNALAERLISAGADAWARPTDVGSAEEVVAFIDGAADRFGGLDVIVMNSSAMAFGDEPEQWRAMLETDLLGATRVFSAARAHLLRSAESCGDAAFTIIASASAIETNRPSAYGAMKAALIHYAKGVAREFASVPIRCNVVSPGMFFTEDGAWGRVKTNNPKLFEEMRAKNPMGRMAEVREIADAVVFLSSPRSGFTSGAHLIIDGAKPARVNF